MEFETIFVSLTEMDLSLVLDGWSSYSADSTFTGKTFAFPFVSVCFLLVCLWLRRVFAVAHRLSLVMESRSCSPAAAHRPPVLASSLAGSGAQVSVALANGLGCPAACGFFIPRPGIEPMSPTLAGEFLTSGPLDHQGSSKAKLLLLD